MADARGLAVALLIAVAVLAVAWGALCLPEGPGAAGTGRGNPADSPGLAQSPGGASQPSGATWYIRPDGGSYEQCNGLADAPFTGGGPSAPCAWDHPFRALPPGGAARISGGDALVIAAGSYMMGFGAPGAETCEADSSWDCHTAPVPSGPDSAHRTRILGAGWDSGCVDPPELWGTERANVILDLTGSSHVRIGCLELTDHSGCVEFHSWSIACEREEPPYGPWAATGLYASDSNDVHVTHVDIHGLAETGARAGRLTDWTVEDMRIAGNGWAGWDGDLDGDDSNSGTMTFRRWIVEWNGCGETWPDEAPTGCWGQTAGGYGDGVGTGATGGDWVIEDSAFMHNTSDGLDLLYVREEGSSIKIRRTISEGNAGNQVKTTGKAIIENSILAGNCGYFSRQTFTFNVDDCRAAGSALGIHMRRGDQVIVTNSTIMSEGDCLVGADFDDERGQMDGSESVVLRNNIFEGKTDFAQPFENTCLAWGEGFASDPFDFDYSVINGVKDDECPGPHHICGDDAGLADGSLDAFDARLLAGSPAIDTGDDQVCPSTDYSGATRPWDGDGDGDATCDIGAFEYLAPPTVTATPTPPAPTATPTATGALTPTPTPTDGGLTGDVDCNGDVDAVDALFVLRDIALLPNSAQCMAEGDVDCDGSRDSVDALFILRHVALLPVALPSGCGPIGD